MAAFLRFVTTRVHKDSHRQEGAFAAAYALLDSGSLDQGEWKRIREILIWFNKNLPTPPGRFSAGRAIFWFKAGSKESISQVWELVHALRLPRISCGGPQVSAFGEHRVGRPISGRRLPFEVRWQGYHPVARDAACWAASSYVGFLVQCKATAVVSAYHRARGGAQAESASPDRQVQPPAPLIHIARPWTWPKSGSLLFRVSAGCIHPSHLPRAEWQAASVPKRKGTKLPDKSEGTADW
jgi:hypothetical protein